MDRRAQSLSPAFFPAIEGMRGIAALLVAISHLANNGYHLIPGIDLGGTGRSAVYLFFVLSAFLLMNQFLTADRARLVAFTVDYLIRRTFRILPLFAAVLLLYALAGVAWWSTDRESSPLSIESALWHLALFEGRDFFWAVPVEFKFYLVLPVIAIPLVLALKQYRLWFAGAVSAVAIAATPTPPRKARLRSCLSSVRSPWVCSSPSFRPSVRLTHV